MSLHDSKRWTYGGLLVSQGTARSIVAVDVGGTWLRIAAVGGTGQVRGLQRMPSRSLLGQPKPEAFVGELCGRLLTELGQSDDGEAAGIVVGLPAVVDRNRGIALSSPNLRVLEGRPFKAYIESRLGLPVLVERDVNLALLGEHAFGAAKGYNYVVGIFIGTGLGCAIMHGGDLLVGAHGSAGELGHIPVRDEEGERCGCGLQGCIELYGSGAFLTRALQRLGRQVDLPEVFGAAERNASLQKVSEEFIRNASLAITVAVTLLDPELVVLGGGVTEMKEFPFDRLVAAIRARLRPPVLPETVGFRRATLGDLAPLLGSLALARRHNLSP